MAESNEPSVSRRDLLRGLMRGAGLVAVGTAGGALLARSRGEGYVWQIRPHECIECGNCSTHCVLETSAVKAVHVPALCGLCKDCMGYYVQQPGMEANAGAEFQICPTHAIHRKPIDETAYRKFEYSIREDLCIGCGKCVKGCRVQNADKDDGALYLQVKHDLCLDCNECSIAAACPSGAFVRVPASTPYFYKFSGKWVARLPDVKGPKK
jgi:electron transport complex protein RnfB